MAAIAERVDEWLSASELHGLTDSPQLKKQSTWLADHKIPHKVDGRRLIVSRMHVRAWLEGRQLVTSTGPDWGAMN